ncbi:MAG TPA: cytochrome c-type biogenesis protein [Steroidobacteraceae bacterium]|nr:cytochrome c-type biogenesis protein [Steroidobacteraceae bacterium]
MKILRTLIAAFALAFAVNALAIDTEPAFPDAALQARYEALTHELRCLVCQNETIADSNATLAGDLRREVREMIAAGKTDEEIKQFMLARYGDFVLYKPRLSGVNFLLWAAPVLLLLLGAVAAVIFIRRRTAEAGIATETDTASEEAGQS